MARSQDRARGPANATSQARPDDAYVVITPEKARDGFACCELKSATINFPPRFMDDAWLEEKMKTDLCPLIDITETEIGDRHKITIKPSCELPFKKKVEVTPKRKFSLVADGDRSALNKIVVLKSMDADSDTLEGEEFCLEEGGTSVELQRQRRLRRSWKFWKSLRSLVRSDSRRASQQPRQVPAENVGGSPTVMQAPSQQGGHDASGPALDKENQRSEQASLDSCSAMEQQDGYLHVFHNTGDKKDLLVTWTKHEGEARSLADAQKEQKSDSWVEIHSEPALKPKAGCHLIVIIQSKNNTYWPRALCKGQKSRDKSQRAARLVFSCGSSSGHFLLRMERQTRQSVRQVGGTTVPVSLFLSMYQARQKNVPLQQLQQNDQRRPSCIEFSM